MFERELDGVRDRGVLLSRVNHIPMRADQDDRALPFVLYMRIHRIEPEREVLQPVAGAALRFTHVEAKTVDAFRDEKVVQDVVDLWWRMQQII